jgi:hypothetical protein
MAKLIFYYATEFPATLYGFGRKKILVKFIERKLLEIAEMWEGVIKNI